MTVGPLLNVGGKFDRLVRWSLWSLLYESLDALGWFQLTVSEGGQRVHRPVTLHREPLPAGEPAVPNAVAFSLDAVWLGDPFELGSHVTAVRQPFAIDVYAENDSIGRELRGDILAVMAGRVPAIGRVSPIVPIVDGSLATPEVVAYAEVEDGSLMGDQASGFSDAWRRHWFTVEGRLEIEPYVREETP